MKWFKHQTNFRSSPQMRAIRRKLGYRGCHAYACLIEFMCERFEGGEPTVEMHYSDWLRELQLGPNSRPTLGQLLANLQVGHEFSGDNLKVHMPQIVEIADEYTQRLGTNSRATPERREERRKHRIESITSLNSDEQNLLKITMLKNIGKKMK